MDLAIAKKLGYPANRRRSVALESLVNSTASGSAQTIEKKVYKNG
ncbi:hypothetical protein [Roseibium sediminicola]|nr:hypothetical protein [Roseibium sp. CAU 1639]